MIDGQMFEKLLPYDVAHLILGKYFGYYHQFKRITKRAKIRFENRDWHGIQEDATERISLYREIVGTTVEKVKHLLGERARDDRTWLETKKHYSSDIQNFNTRNIAETFYNSVFRHAHKGLGADSKLMFVHATATYREFKSTEPIFQTYGLDQNTTSLFKDLFRKIRFEAPWQDLERDINLLVSVLDEEVELRGIGRSEYVIHILKSIFFRNKGAYIVGRIYSQFNTVPFVIPLLHDERGIYVDAVLMDDIDVSSIFSYNRSYFLADVDIVSETVDFLRSILPLKNLGELYNSIGFEKHGKTVFYRDFLRHLAKSDESFMMAPGIKGMVMSVFTLPTYNMVFKVIRDEFAPPKNATQEEVKEKYELVNRHNRVGRMTDSHMFENLVLDKRRFTDDLLSELVEEARSKYIVTEDTVEIKHLYVEKRMIPLNIYLETASKEDAEDVIDEYGKAIKQMAAVNIFPGDMLLKNFGVTRLKRVVFYDYDEIGFLTDYNFRRIPDARDDFDEFAATPFYHVGPNDIFPEEFPKFLIGNPELREIFFRLHGDLYDVKFWRDMQKKLKQKEIVDVYPYRDKKRFRTQPELEGSPTERQDEF